MRELFSAPLTSFVRLWRTDAALTATGVGMMLVLLAAGAGLWIDPRTIAGAPAWLKPAKFAASTAIYSVTLAWIFTFLPEWPRTRRLAGRTTALVFIVEVAIISAQAWRGVTSHFNVATPLDTVLFGVMGTAILLQTVAALLVVVALWHQRFDDAAMGWALRLGLLISVVAAFSGGLMTRPTPAQLADVRATGRMTVSGAHTVGAPDGGPGLPITGWSVDRGDLRVAHFTGLHAMQVLPVLALAVGATRRTGAAGGPLMVSVASSYAGLFLILLWQALRGQSVVAPDAATLVAFGVWLLATTASAWLSIRGPGLSAPLPWSPSHDA